MDVGSSSSQDTITAPIGNEEEFWYYLQV
jgi:hypothetical protein